MRPLLLSVLLSLLTSVGLSAQTMVLQDSPPDSAAAILADILANGDYRVLDRDTVLGTDARIASDLVVVDARVAVEGRIEGAVAIVNSDFFIRPGATVAGPIAVISAGVYPSGNATIGEIVHVDPELRVAVRSRGREHSVAIRHRPGPGLFRLPYLFGFSAPTYDRVDGLSLFWSARAGPPGDEAPVSLTGTLGYRTERGRVGAEALLQLRPTPGTLTLLRAGRATHTNEEWIRSDLPNSLAAFLVRSDARDYFESDEVALTVRTADPPPLIQGESFVTPSLTARISRDRSLSAGNPWTLLDHDEPWRPNAAIDEGVLASLVAGLDLGWRGVTSLFDGGVAVEWAPGVLGDFEFAQLRAHADWSMTALFRHTIHLSGNIFLPLGGEEAPLQRWTFVGGSGTLQTFEKAAMRGDHMVFVESEYVAPLPIVLPVVGPPALRLTHAAGAAWRTGADMPSLEQNFGVGLQLLFFHAMMYADPAATEFDPEFSLGADLPLGGLGGF